jgi:hypothetical protein
VNGEYAEPSLRTLQDRFERKPLLEEAQHGRQPVDAAADDWQARQHRRSLCEGKPPDASEPEEWARVGARVDVRHTEMAGEDRGSVLLPRARRRLLQQHDVGILLGETPTRPREACLK